MPASARTDALLAEEMRMSARNLRIKLETTTLPYKDQLTILAEIQRLMESAVARERKALGSGARDR